MATENEQHNEPKRGFASMDAEKQRAIAAKGGKAAHAQGRAHEFSREEACAAGRKGGESISKDRQHMAEIGRIGGLQRGRNRAARLQQRDESSSNVAESSAAE